MPGSAGEAGGLRRWHAAARTAQRSRRPPRPAPGRRSRPRSKAPARRSRRADPAATCESCSAAEPKFRIATPAPIIRRRMSRYSCAPARGRDDRARRYAPARHRRRPSARRVDRRCAVAPRAASTRACDTARRAADRTRRRSWRVRSRRSAIATFQYGMPRRKLCVPSIGSTTQQRSIAPVELRRRSLAEETRRPGTPPRSRGVISVSTSRSARLTKSPGPFSSTTSSARRRQ